MTAAPAGGTRRVPSGCSCAASGLRRRRRFHAGGCAIPVVGTVFTAYVLETGARWYAFQIQLAKLATRLGKATTWTWRLDAENMATIRVWRRVNYWMLVILVNGPMWGAFWFIYPAAQRSRIVHACWWFAIMSAV